MRLFGVLILAIVMYVAVPLLWQRAMVDKVKEVSANSADIPVGNAVEVNWEASANLTNGITNHVEINTEPAQQAQAEDNVNQAQAVSDRAWAETHSN